MTKKLYYEDAYIQNFSSAIVKMEVNYVVLSETAFYPTGGGQPNDTGTLNGIEVVDVEIVEGEIRHFLASPLPSDTTYVEGQVDWTRRFDHMQQHTGQHIISAAFDNLFGMKTVSFHLGKESSTIDLGVTAISEQQLQEVEALANEIILQNLPIETKWVTEDELTQYKLRKATKVKEDIRLVIIPDYDYNACGGTHPKGTGEVSSIKILQTEKQKSNIRVEFICGQRVIQHLHRKHAIITNLISSLSSPEEKLEEAVHALLGNNKALEKQIINLKNSILEYEASDLIQRTDGPLITSIFQNRSIQELQKLAKIISATALDKTCLFVAENTNQIQIVAAKGSGVEQSMKALMGHILPLINGKGGGNEAAAQGGGERLLSGNQLLEESKAFLTSS